MQDNGPYCSIKNGHDVSNRFDLRGADVLNRQIHILLEAGQAKAVCPRPRYIYAYVKSLQKSRSHVPF